MIGQEELCQERSRLGVGKNCFNKRVSQGLEQGGQGNGRITMPGSRCMGHLNTWFKVGLAALTNVRTG